MVKKFLIIILAIFLLASCSASEDVGSNIIDEPVVTTKEKVQELKGPLCGDATCESGENKCSCPADCGKCSGNINTTHEQSCETGSCVVTEMNASCGDNVCHPTEQGNCAIDCPNCADTDKCTRDYFDSSSRKCKHDEVIPCCGNGACEVGESASCIDDCESEFDLSDYPEPFIVEKQFNTFIVIGENAGPKGVLAGINVIRGLDFSGVKPGYSSEAKLDSEIDSIDGKNVILVGNPCHNKFVAELYGKTKDNCGDGLKSGDQIIRLFKTGASTYAIVISGYNEDDVRSASVLVEKYDETAMTGNEVKR